MTRSLSEADAVRDVPKPEASPHPWWFVASASCSLVQTHSPAESRVFEWAGTEGTGETDPVAEEKIFELSYSSR
jgi:hypothetical protein